jgi:hypothetical protein
MNENNNFNYNIGDKVVAVINYPGKLETFNEDYSKIPNTCIGTIVNRNILGPNKVYNVRCNSNGITYNHIAEKWIKNYETQKKLVEENSMVFMRNRNKANDFNVELGGKRTKTRKTRKSKKTQKRKGKKTQKRKGKKTQKRKSKKRRQH